MLENENLNKAENPQLNIGVVSTRFSFRYFKDGMEELMMLDNLDEETKDEYMNDWYILFKEQKHDTVADFVEWQFPIDEVNEDTHNFWKRSLK
jgi:hypothetical protein